MVSSRTARRDDSEARGFSRAPRQHRPRGLVIEAVSSGWRPPPKRGQLAGSSDRDDAGGLAALAGKHDPALMQSALRAPGDLHHSGVLAFLAACDRGPDRGVVAVVVSGLDEQSAGMQRSRLRDRALPALGVRGALGRNDPEKPRQLGAKSIPVTDLSAQPGRRQCVDPSKAAQPGDRRGVPAARFCGRAPITPSGTTRPAICAHPCLGIARSPQAPPVRSAGSLPSLHRRERAELAQAANGVSFGNG